MLVAILCQRVRDWAADMVHETEPVRRGSRAAPMVRYPARHVAANITPRGRMPSAAEQTCEMPFELESLAKAVNYQRWVAEAIRPYMGRRILEVGAGIGNMSQWLPVHERLVLTETEPALLDVLHERTHEYFGEAASKVSVSPFDLNGPSPDLTQLQRESFDTIVSFNVLEHIADDRAAVEQLLAILGASDRPVRRLVSFVPAQSWAFSQMDRFYGHFRRYSAGRIREISRELAPDAQLSLTPFNAIGLLGWTWTTLILKRSVIDPGSVKAFDAICPYIKPIDNFICRTLRYPLGQSFVWVLTLPRGSAAP
jgi:SAM-dependent methyltransferase